MLGNKAGIIMCIYIYICMYVCIRVNMVDLLRARTDPESRQTSLVRMCYGDQYEKILEKSFLAWAYSHLHRPLHMFDH